MSVTAYTFGPFRLDLKAHRLLRDGVPVELSVHLVDVLAFLVSHAGELVERDRLLDALWPGVFVTDNTVTRAISELRRALQDDPRDAQFIQTAARLSADGSMLVFLHSAPPADDHARIASLNTDTGTVQTIVDLRASVAE